MKKVLVMVALVMASVIVYAFNDSRETNQGKKEVTGNGEVVVMDKEMFLKDVFDYEKSKEWNYKGNKPAIIDLYADWCGPCRQTAPIMKELAKVGTACMRYLVARSSCWSTSIFAIRALYIKR